MSFINAKAYIYLIYAYPYVSHGDSAVNEQIARTEKQLGAVLRRVRKQEGLTQGALGKKVHLRQGTISRLEAGEPAVQLRTLMEVLSALGLELTIRPRSVSGPAEIEGLF